MVKSMTGYGKAECSPAGVKHIVEIRSLNGKNADINIKSQLIPKEHEIEVRQYIAQKLGRGTIDLYINLENAAADAAGTVNGELVRNYYGQILDAVDGTALSAAACMPKDNILLTSILRMPNVVEYKKQEFGPEEWEILFEGIKEAVENLNSFREREGKALRADVLAKVELIESYVANVEQYEMERIDNVRNKLAGRIEELKLNPDKNRFEQEIIFYLEKLDINEEKVRLRQHCRYYCETLDQEEMPGKKLGFITQEMGREINTMGSKANHAEIQKWVVKMKDELEKIKEQSLNIL